MVRTGSCRYSAVREEVGYALFGEPLHRMQDGQRGIVYPGCFVQYFRLMTETLGYMPEMLFQAYPPVFPYQFVGKKDYGFFPWGTPVIFHVHVMPDDIAHFREAQAGYDGSAGLGMGRYSLGNVV